MSDDLFRTKRRRMGPPPMVNTRTADTITAAHQPYYASYHLIHTRAKGYPGQGDTSAPELTSPSFTDKIPCAIASSLTSKRHGTAVASVLTSPAYGVAPQASVLTYRTAITKAGDIRGDDCRDKHGSAMVGHAAAINRGIKDGAQLISISETGSSDIKWAMAHALSKGVLVVVGAGNNGDDVFSTNSLDRWSGGVGVGAMLNIDPPQCPDENPLVDKARGRATSPTAEEVQQYADGLTSPSEIEGDSSYAYRGLDENQLKAATNIHPTHTATSPRYHW